MSSPFVNLGAERGNVCLRITIELLLVYLAARDQVQKAIYSNKKFRWLEKGCEIN